MLAIRLLRTGKKNQPSFKIVVVEKSRSSISGRFVEQVGFYNSLTKEKSLKAERIKHWLSVGAKPSDTVYNLLISQKIIEGAKTPVHKKSKKQKEEPAELQQTETAKAEKIETAAETKTAAAAKKEPEKKEETSS